MGISATRLGTGVDINSATRIERPLAELEAASKAISQPISPEVRAVYSSLTQGSGVPTGLIDYGSISVDQRDNSAARAIKMHATVRPKNVLFAPINYSGTTIDFIRDCANVTFVNYQLGEAILFLNPKMYNSNYTIDSGDYTDGSAAARFAKLLTARNTTANKYYRKLANIVHAMKVAILAQTNDTNPFYSMEEAEIFDRMVEYHVLIGRAMASIYNCKCALGMKDAFATGARTYFDTKYSKLFTADNVLRLQQRMGTVAANISGKIVIPELIQSYLSSGVISLCPSQKGSFKILCPSLSLGASGVKGLLGGELLGSDTLTYVDNTPINNAIDFFDTLADSLCDTDVNVMTAALAPFNIGEVLPTLDTVAILPSMNAELVRKLRACTRHSNFSPTNSNVAYIGATDRSRLLNQLTPSATCTMPTYISMTYALPNNTSLSAPRYSNKYILDIGSRLYGMRSEASYQQAENGNFYEQLLGAVCGPLLSDKFLRALEVDATGYALGRVRLLRGFAPSIAFRDRDAYRDKQAIVVHKGILVDYGSATPTYSLQYAYAGAVEHGVYNDVHILPFKASASAFFDNFATAYLTGVFSSDEEQTAPATYISPNPSIDNNWSRFLEDIPLAADKPGYRVQKGNWNPLKGMTDLLEPLGSITAVVGNLIGDTGSAQSMKLLRYPIFSDTIPVQAMLLIEAMYIGLYPSVGNSDDEFAAAWDNTFGVSKIRVPDIAITSANNTVLESTEGSARGGENTGDGITGLGTVDFLNDWDITNLFEVSLFKALQQVGQESDD